MFLKDCNGTFRVFVWMKCLRLMKMDYWAEHANNKWLFGHELYGTNQSLIVELGFLGVPSDEDHQR